MARWTAPAFVAKARAENFRKPNRPVGNAESGAGESGFASGEIEGADEGLGAFLAAIAEDVARHAAATRVGVNADFAARITEARRSYPRHQAEGIIAGLRQARKAALALVKKNAALELQGRQKAAMLLWRRKRLRIVKGVRRPPSHDPGSSPEQR